MTNLQYYSHILLQSKYRFLFILTVYLLILFTLTNYNLLQCMMEAPDSPLTDASLEIEGENVPPYSPDHPLYVAPEYPETAEAKQKLANQSPILQEMESYTASQEQLLKRLNEQADHYARQEKLMTDRIYDLMREKDELFQELSKAHEENLQYRMARHDTLVKAYDDAYKTYMEHFKKNEDK